KNLAPHHSHLPIILFAGRWVPEKRIARLASTVPPSACLCIIGSGPLPLPSLLHSPSSRVYVHQGFVPHDKIYDLYRAVDFVANASDFETFGNTTYEGNSVGTPCVLHPKGGHLSQIVEEGTNGCFVDFDLPDEVVRASMEKVVCRRWDRDVVRGNMVRRIDAVGIEDVIRVRQSGSGRGGEGWIERAAITFNKGLSKYLLVPLALAVGIAVNVMVVLCVTNKAGYETIKADSYEDR
ncbi:hypothetical protein TrRE_jg9650, partial [Triparma retinervis]